MTVLEREASGADMATLPSVVATYRRVFDTILALIAFPDLDKPFVATSKDPVYGLWNPKSKACYSMVWMYSLEPPLYFMLNKAMRSKNKAYLQMLGPFAQAISMVLGYAEGFRNDCIKEG